MANANTTLSRTQSKPERLALFLFKHAANWRLMLAFLLVVSLTAISVTFNVLLGEMSGIEGTLSKYIFPTGYALLDLSALFLCGYVGLKAIGWFKWLLAWSWFGFLLCLSLWAAATFTLAIDSQRHSASTEHSIDQKRSELYSINSDVDLWRSNVANTERFRTRYQDKLEDIQHRQLMASDELAAMEANLPQPTMAIYNMVAPYFGFTPESLQTIVRLLWAAALTLSPLVIMLLINNEKPTTSAPKAKQSPLPTKKTKLSMWTHLGSLIASKFSLKKRAVLQRTPERETVAEFTEDRATQTEFPALIDPVKGHNGATPAEHLNGLKYCLEWLKIQPTGRVTRAKLGLVSKIKNREGVTKIITALIDQGRLVRLNNGQLSKPEHHLRLIK